MAKVLNKPESPSQEVRALAFINSTLEQYFLTQVAIPPSDADTQSLGPQDYQIREVMLGKATLDTAKLMVTMGIKEVFKSMEHEGVKFRTLQR